MPLVFMCWQTCTVFDASRVTTDTVRDKASRHTPAQRWRGWTLDGMRQKLVQSTDAGTWCAPRAKVAAQAARQKMHTAEGTEAIDWTVLGDVAGKGRPPLYPLQKHDVVARWTDAVNGFSPAEKQHKRRPAQSPQWLQRFQMVLSPPMLDPTKR
ncbi:hypothetical protein NLG97_g10567 [Lecanicillium saksenae]|uniref:Uncharacterized protein n=1 Tax=Lecanicillium saksenae TaxID=468837 RepID=A0ACC1QCT4_9HYPO|nr:hypothetical protein NLG97_g10567 [Lecanicillium saksenae]